VTIYQQLHQYQQPQTTEYKKDNDIWHWKSRSWLAADTCGL